MIAVECWQLSLCCNLISTALLGFAALLWPRIQSPHLLVLSCSSWDVSCLCSTSTDKAPCTFPCHRTGLVLIKLQGLLDPLGPRYFRAYNMGKRNYFFLNTQFEGEQKCCNFLQYVWCRMLLLALGEGQAFPETVVFCSSFSFPLWDGLATQYWLCLGRERLPHPGLYCATDLLCYTLLRGWDVKACLYSQQAQWEGQEP